MLANTNVLTRENLVAQLRKSVRAAVGFEPGECIDPIEGEKYSRMERHLLDTVQIVESYSDEKFDVQSVINNHLLNKELIEAQMAN